MQSITGTARGSAHNGGPGGGFKQLADQLREIRQAEITIWTVTEGRLPS